MTAAPTFAQATIKEGQSLTRKEGQSLFFRPCPAKQAEKRAGPFFTLAVRWKRGTVPLFGGGR
jgi:hypothetical protein